MKIDVDCPGCGKRYEVAESFAGKKSRCKQCGTSFRIPPPNAETGGESSRPPAVDALSRSPHIQEPARRPAEVPVPASPLIVPSGAARGTIVLNCPRCFKRYEVDAALTGKKSRCKDCKEVFTIPAPLTTPAPPPRVPAPAAKNSSPGLRNFTVIPEEVISHSDDEEFVEFQPVEEIRRAPKPVLEEEPLELTPRRLTSPKRSGRSSRRADVDTEVGVTVAGAYGALAILAFVVLAIWHAAGEPGSDRVSRVFGASLIIMYILGLLMATWANIWLLVIAFRDKIEQGLFCLLIPCYAIYYIFSRWRETRGIFAMCFAPSVVVILFALFGGLMLGVRGPATFVTELRDRLEFPDADTAPGVNSPQVAAAEQTIREYIRTMKRVTDDLSRIQPPATGVQNPAELQMHVVALQQSALQLVTAENRAKSIRLSKKDMIVLKIAIGDEMRAAIIALKQQIGRIESLPGLSGAFRDAATSLDQMLVLWEAPTEEENALVLADQSRSGSLRPNAVPRTLPVMPPGLPPVRGPLGIEIFEDHYNRLRSQYGDRAVMVVLSGLPFNSDPAKGVTKRDVEDAIDKKLKVLAPGASQSMSTGSGDRRSICVAPVDDVKALTDAIDFGKASRQASRIDVVVSKEYIASVPRLPAEPKVAIRAPEPREKEPEIPPNADPVTKSLIQLKSADMFRKKEALERLARLRPSDRLNEVLAPILPLLEHDDEDLVKHAVRVLAVWQSPEALVKLSDLANDSRVFLRWEIIKALGKYDEPKAAQALTQRLKDDGHQAEEALKSMGSVAEPPLIGLLRNPDADLRKKACEVLKFVGGAATLKAMSALPPDPEFFVRVAAQDAIKTINLRVGPPASDTPETKKGPDPPIGRTRKKS